MRLGVIFVSSALLALLCTMVQESSGLPWEDVNRVLSTRQMKQHTNKRDLNLPACPIHPPPVPQALINQTHMPERLRNATALIGQRFKAHMQQASISTASLGIVYDQALVWNQGFGLINPSDPSSHVDSNTIFRIGSITKVITDIMLFKLRDEGKLALDDPISKYVPELTWPTPFKNNPGITWRTLAGQTSGLTGATPCNFFTIWEPFLGDACDISNAEAWKRVTSDQPGAPMWQLPHYADSAYAIIGRALESVVGMSWENYVTQHIFKPLGMNSSYMAYDSWSEMAKRVPPGMIQNTTFPTYVTHADLHWARPTGNVYSTVRDLAKLASLFMVGQGETKNALGIYTSTLREMLTASFVNNDQATGYGYPFEIYHTSAFGEGLPPYWCRMKSGSMPGYYSVLSLFPEIKTAVVVQTTGNYPHDEMIGTLLLAMEQTLWELRELPTNPGNLTAYEGTYLASEILGLIQGNVTVQADLPNNQLILSFGIGGKGLPGHLGVAPAVWLYGNTFRVLRKVSSLAQPCLDLEAGFTNAPVHFTVGEPWFGGPAKVVSLMVPADPFYGWVFQKQ